ncbi:MAG: primosomal protein N', partial [Deltaproteobacteria bacterium]|nr:primosomal protein N' [Deltaproteobacteria bacterium]
CWSQGELDALFEQGLVERRSHVQKGGPGAVFERILTAPPPPDGPPPSGPRQQEVLDLVRTRGPITMTEVREVIPAADRVVPLLVARKWLNEERRRSFRQVSAGMSIPSAPERLNASQVDVIGKLLTALESRRFSPFLLHGVTGSGKTEVYIHAARKALDAGRTALILVPEIALTPQLMAIFEARFPGQVAILHSGLGPGERYDQWSLVAEGRLRIVLGARSAIFAPLDSLGLLVVDEEHEPSFKQDERPFYSARDLALVRGRMAEAVVVLGSATPSLESFQNCSTGRFTRLSLPERATPRSLPDVRLLDLRQARYADSDKVFSEPLADALKANLQAGFQSILFLNRKGFAAFLLCEQCGFVPGCPNCSISLTWYRQASVLRCHYCQHAATRPAACPTCGQPEGLKQIGFGTERVESALRQFLPDARVARVDSSISSGKGFARVLEAFRKGDLDILVGTQIVAKGHDFPNVTLVGVLLADLGLSFPDFRSAERTFQLLTQVAGRAGRGKRPGSVLVQTYLPTHYALTHAQRHDFSGFAQEELSHRRMRRFPPFACLALFRFSGEDLGKVQEQASLATRVLSAAADRVAGSDVMGPSPAPIAMVRNRHRLQVLVRCPDRPRLQKLLEHAVPRLQEQLSRSGTVRWDVDVDPINLM